MVHYQSTAVLRTSVAGMGDTLYGVGVGALAVVAMVALVARRRVARRRGALAALAAVALFGLAVGGYARWVETRWIEVTTTRIPWRGRALRIAVVSDLHAGRTPAGMIRRAVELVMAEHPDLILLAGDYVSAYSVDARKLSALGELRALHAPLGVIAVLGNHDTEAPGESPRAARIAGTLEELGITVLRGAARRLDDGVAVIGLDDYRGGTDAPAAFAGLDAATPRIVVVHDWHALTREPRQTWDVAVAGHTHGGQLCVPFTQACVMGRASQPYLRGLHPFPEGGFLYVTRGIGESDVAARLGARPEVTILELVPRELGVEYLPGRQ
jgi:uncharacterized protein